MPVTGTGLDLFQTIGTNEAAAFGRFTGYGAKKFRTGISGTGPFRVHSVGASGDFDGTVAACGPNAWWGVPFPAVAVDVNAYRFEEDDAEAIPWAGNGPDGLTRSATIAGHGTLTFPAWAPCSTLGPAQKSRWVYRAQIPAGPARTGRDDWNLHLHAQRWDQVRVSLPATQRVLGSPGRPFVAGEWLAAAGTSVALAGGALSLTAPGGGTGAAVRRYLANDGQWWRLSYRWLRLRVRSVGSANQTFRLEALGGFWGAAPIRWDVTTGADGTWVERDLDLFAPAGLVKVYAPPWSQLLHGWQLSQIPAGVTIEVEWLDGRRADAETGARVSALYNRRDTAAKVLTSWSNWGFPTVGDVGGGVPVGVPAPYAWQAAGVEGRIDGLLTLEPGAVFGGGQWGAGSSIDTVEQVLGYPAARLGVAWALTDLSPVPADWATSGPYPGLAYLRCKKHGWHYHLGGGGRLRPANPGDPSPLQIDLSVPSGGRDIPTELWYPGLTLYPGCGEIYAPSLPGGYGAETWIWGETTLRGQMWGRVVPVGGATLPAGLQVEASRRDSGGATLGPEGSGLVDASGDFKTGAPATWDEEDGGNFSTAHAPVALPPMPETTPDFGVGLPDRSRGVVYLFWGGQEEAGRWLSADRSQTGRAVRAYLADDGEILFEMGRNPELGAWELVPTGIVEDTPCVRHARDAAGTILLVTASGGSVKMRATVTEGRAFSVATTILSGPGYSFPTLLVGRTGLRYYFAVYGSSIRSVVTDAQGAVVIAQFTAVASGVAADALAALERDGRVWLLYRDTGGNIVQVSSTDGRTYA